jgi:hypothetical protein
MRWRIPIRSRVGNAVLAVLGVLYFLCAITLLGYSLLTGWGAISPVDLMIQLILAAIALGGVVFISVAVDNLQLRERIRPSAPGSPGRRTVAAARP